MTNKTVMLAETIEKEVRRWEHLAEAAAVLKRIGSLEQAELEAKQRLERAQQDDAEVAARLKAARQQVDEAQNLAEKIHRDADAAAKQVAVDAADKAYDVVQEATARAAQNVADAQVSAEAVVKRADEEVNIANQKRSEADAQRVKVLEETEAARQELSELTAKIEQARERVREMLA